MAARLADGLLEWRALQERAAAKWANYSYFETQGAHTLCISDIDIGEYL